MEDDVIDLDEEDILDTKSTYESEIIQEKIGDINQENSADKEANGPENTSHRQESDISSDLGIPDTHGSGDSLSSEDSLPSEEDNSLTITIETGQRISLSVLIKSLIKKDTRPHIFLIFCLAIPLHIFSENKSLASFTAVAYVSLAISYLLIAILSNKEKVRNFVINYTTELDSNSDKGNLIKSFRVVILPLIVASSLFFIMAGLFSEGSSLEFIGNLLPQALASLFLLWAVAQSRSFRATATSFIASRIDESSDKKNVNSTISYLLICGAVIFLGIGLLYLFRSVESGFDRDLISVLVEDWPFVITLGLLCAVSIVSTRGIISEFNDDVSKRRSIRWILFCTLFVMWHTMTIYRKMVIESSAGLGSMIEEVILMLVTIVLAIWALTSSQTKSDFPIINENNAIFVGISFGFAYAGSVAMLTSTLDGIIEVISAGHAVAAISLLMLQRTTIKQSLRQENAEARIQDLAKVESKTESNPPV